VLGATADQLAKTTDFIKRQRQLPGAKFVRALTLGWLPKPTATLEELTPSGVLNEVEISPQGGEQTVSGGGCHRSSTSLRGSGQDRRAGATVRAHRVAKSCCGRVVGSLLP
jgi:hypothetical protein